MENIKTFDGFDLKERFNINKNEILEKYEKLLETGKKFRYEFPMCTAKGILFGFDGDVQVRFSKEENKNKDVDFLLAGRKTKKKVGDTYDVVVTEIDKVNRIVYVVADNGSSSERQQLINALKESLKNKEFIRVPATVVGFTGKDKYTHEKNRSVILIDIGNLGIVGAIRRAEWSILKTKDLTHSVSIGDVVEVAVIDVHEWGSAKVFDCSRKLIMKEDNINPWKGIESRVPRKTQLTVTCIDKRQNNFFGIVDTLKELEVLCEYPDSDINIELNKKYIGRVYRVSEEKQQLCVRIEEEVIE